MVAAVFSLCALTVGCSTSPEKIQAAYVSPLAYQSYNCGQLGAEMSRINNRVQGAASGQQSESTKDAAAMGVGLVIFWPALFFMIGDDRKEELARLKGEAEAVEQAAIQKECGELLAQIQGAKNAQQKIDAEKKSEYEECLRFGTPNTCRDKLGG